MSALSCLPESRSTAQAALRLDAEGGVQHRPFRHYVMKQAAQERFILDVLAHYVPVDSYYKLIKKIEDDPEFDTKRAKKKLRRYVESHDHAVRLKAEIVVDHFHEQVLAEETDPNKLHDQKAALDGTQVVSPDQVQHFATLFLAGAERDQLDPILDACVAAYTGTLEEDQQVDFKGKAKVFCRTHDFLASVMPGANVAWEKLSILLNLLVSKLPAPKEEDLALGLLEASDMDSDRVEKKAPMKIVLADADADKAFQNARDNTPHTARIAHDQALVKAAQILLKDDTLFYKQFVENESFRRSVGDLAYQVTRDSPRPSRP